MDCLVYGHQLPLDAPTGFVLQLTIFSTWGDAYYVGLTGVQLYGPDGAAVPVTDTSKLLLDAFSLQLLFCFFFLWCHRLIFCASVNSLRLTSHAFKRVKHKMA